jgi:uncharacterized protein (TIGR02147 family)
MESETYYIHKLKEILSQKQKENPYYSMRAYARDINVNSATLSQVLNGKRGLPFKRAYDVSQSLTLSPKEQTLFMESFHRSKTNIDKIQISDLDERFILDESYYAVIAEWEHYAVLEFFNFEYFEINTEFICEKLAISPLRAEVVLVNLMNSNLIVKDSSGEYIKAHDDIRTTEDISSNALRKSHKETLEIGINKLEEIEVKLRDFSTETIAVDLDKLPEAKTIIREFRQKMTALLRDGKKTDVFQLAIQFYPLTKIKNKMEKLQ